MIVSHQSAADMIDLDDETNQQETNSNQEERCLSMELRRGGLSAVASAAAKQARDTLLECREMEGKRS